MRYRAWDLGYTIGSALRASFAILTRMPCKIPVWAESEVGQAARNEAQWMR